MDLTSYLPKGDLTNFPKEIIAKLLEHQKNQTGKVDISVFEKNRMADLSGGGIFWANTPEGINFWNDILLNECFSTYFQRYPQDTFRRGEKVLYNGYINTFVSYVEGSRKPYILTKSENLKEPFDTFCCALIEKLEAVKTHSSVEALQALKDGKKIKRINFTGNPISIKNAHWCIPISDLLEDDWLIL